MKIFIQQWLRKRFRILRGILNSSKSEAADKAWGDKKFYAAGIKSDASTISVYTSEIVSKYHYSSIELKILGYLHNNQREVTDKTVLDIGSGSGHWLEFYGSLGARRLTGVDVSEVSCHYLTSKFSNNQKVHINCGKISNLSPDDIRQGFDIVNAIGVMFHIVEDKECIDTIQRVYDLLTDGGIFVIGGHFGWLHGINVQIDGNTVNKRLRSKRWYFRELQKSGFKKIVYVPNNAYLQLNWLTPEANLLIASK